MVKKAQPSDGNNRSTDGRPRPSEERRMAGFANYLSRVAETGYKDFITGKIDEAELRRKLQNHVDTTVNTLKGMKGTRARIDAVLKSQ